MEDGLMGVREGLCEMWAMKIGAKGPFALFLVGCFWVWNVGMTLSTSQHSKGGQDW